jgi:hypothetical protein
MMAFQYLPSGADGRRNRLRQAIGAIAKGTSSVMEQGATARAGTELLDESSFVGELI